jgi:hypothetical protein
MQKKHIYLLFLVICPLLPSCDTTKNREQNDSVALHDTIVLSDTLQQKYRSLIESLPAPLEMLRQLTNSGVTYRDSLVNPADRVSNYSNSNSQAINLGIYGADMSYLTAMEQFNKVNGYIRSVKKIADVIVIPTAFDESMMKQYDTNRSNSDTLNAIIYKSYKRIDATLQDNQRLGLATLVVCGSWVEAMYITTSHLEKGGNAPSPGKTNTKALYDLLDHQKTHLKKLAQLAGSFTNDPFFAELSTSLNELAELFPEKGTPDAKLLREITPRVAALRTRMVNMN